jgi:hypothetical protein
MAAAPTANDIKAQLKALLDPLIGTSLTKKVKVIAYMAMAFKPGEGEDPGVLRSTLDPTTLAQTGEVVNRVNCLMISEAGFNQAPAQRDETRTVTLAAGRNLITRRFRLTYFYQFGQQSENVFSDNVEVIRMAINDSPKLGFATIATDHTAGQGAYIHDHNQLQMPVMLPDAFGDVICHVAEGELTVRVIEPRG